MIKFLKNTLAQRYSSSSLKEIQKMLKISKDKYNAIHITPENAFASSSFQAYMTQLLKDNENSATTSVWVHLPSEYLHFISYLVNSLQFQIHHGLGNKVSLYKWLLKSKEDLVVPYSMHHVGCGGIIIRDNHLFLIREKAGELKGRYGIPGGRANFGEGIKQCVQRQIFEQVGIKSKFKNILWIRQLSNYTYNAFDLYFACLLHAQPIQFDNIKLCDHEIDKTEWVHFSQLRQFSKEHSFGTQLQLSSYLCDLYERGFDFQSIKPNYQQQIYQSQLDKKHRFFAQHKLVDIK